MYVSYRIIGDNLRCARRHKDLTQEKLANLIGMSSLHYGRLERGERQVSLEHLARIADTLGISTMSLLNGCLINEPQSAFPTEESGDFARQLASITAGCTSAELELIREIIMLVSQFHKKKKSQ